MLSVGASGAAPEARPVSDSVLSPVRFRTLSGQSSETVGNLAIRRNQAPARPGVRDDPEEAIMTSRVGVIVASIVAGILLAAGAAYGVTAIATTPQTPANQNPYNYGPP